MAQIKWQKTFETNIPQIDEQHKKLVEMINRLDASLHQGTGKVIQEEGAVLTALVDYTKYHFDAEENVMKEIGYGELQKHRGLHEELKYEIASILKRLKMGESLGVYELTSFLTDWLLNHIIKEDLKLGKAYASAHPQAESAR